MCSAYLPLLNQTHLPPSYSMDSTENITVDRVDRVDGADGVNDRRGGNKGVLNRGTSPGF